MCSLNEAKQIFFVLNDNNFNWVTDEGHIHLVAYSKKHLQMKIACGCMIIQKNWSRLKNRWLKKKEKENMNKKKRKKKSKPQFGLHILQMTWRSVDLRGIYFEFLYLFSIHTHKHTPPFHSYSSLIVFNGKHKLPISTWTANQTNKNQFIYGASKEIFLLIN